MGSSGFPAVLENLLKTVFRPATWDKPYSFLSDSLLGVAGEVNWVLKVFLGRVRGFLFSFPVTNLPLEKETPSYKKDRVI